MRWRAEAAGALLAGEYLLVSLSFDARVLVERTDAWRLFGHLGSVGPLVLSVLTVGALVALRPGARPLRLAIPARELTRTVGTLLVAHLAAFALFFWATATVFGDRPDVAVAARALVAWAMTGTLSVVLLVLATVPAQWWRGLRATPARVLFGVAGAGLVTWALGLLGRMLPQALIEATVRATGGLLTAVGARVEVQSVEALLAIDDFAVIVTAPCSGLEGMGLMLVLTGVYLWVMRAHLRFPAALWLLPLGVAMAWLGNVVRLAALMLIGRHVSEDVALGGFHSKAGWLMFCVLALGLAAAARGSRLFARIPDVSAGTENPAAAFLLPFLGTLAVALATGAFATEVDRLYGLRIVAAVALLLAFRRPLLSVLPSRGMAGGFWISVALGAGAFAAFVVLSPRPEAATVQAWQAEWQALTPASRTALIGWRVLGSVLVIPVVEELAFRGYLFRRLMRPAFEDASQGQWAWWPALASSAIFGLVHRGWAAGAAAGFLFALAQARSGSVRGAIIAHGAANLLVAGYVIALDNWWLWI